MDEITHTDSCQNCDFAPLETPFCPNCGQKKLSNSDLKISSLASEAVQGILNFENSFFRTLKHFLLNPSEYVSAYNKGARKKYISPLKWFLIANALYFFFPVINTFTTNLQYQLNNQMYSGMFSGFVESFIAASQLSFLEFEIRYNEITKTLSKVFLVLLPIMFSGITWLTNLRHKRRKPLLFHVNRSLILYAFLLLIVLLVVPFIYVAIFQLISGGSGSGFINDTLITSFSFIAINVYGFFLYRGFFESTLWKNIIRVLVLNAAFYGLVIVYRAMLLFLTLLWIKVF